MLGTIRTDAPVDLNLEDYRLGEGDRKEALRLMAKLEFFSLIDKMGLRREGDEPSGGGPGRRGTDGNGRIAGGLFKSPPKKSRRSASPLPMAKKVRLLNAPF